MQERNVEDKAIKEIPANRRAYRLVESGGELHSATGARYQRQPDGSLRRADGRITKHLRRKMGLRGFTNAQVEQAVRDAHGAK
jgi:hypothetical protein